MKSKFSRTIAFILGLMMFIISVPSLGLGVELETDLLQLSKDFVKVGEEIQGRLAYDQIVEGAMAFLTSPGGEEVSLELEVDEDSGALGFNFQANQPGTWSVNSVVLNGENFIVNKEFRAVNSLSEIYGGEAPYVVDGLEDGILVTNEELISSLSSVVFLDEDSNSLEVQVSMFGPETYNFELLSDGLSITSSENLLEIAPGSYDLVFKSEGREVYKNINLMATMAQESFLSTNRNVPVRLSGSNRMGTAVEISKEAYEKSDVVLIANGEVFNDALASISISSSLKAPLLFSTHRLYDDSLNEIKRLGAKKALIIGSHNQVPARVEDQLKQIGISVERVSGNSSQDTALNIARQMAKYQKYDRVILASEKSYPDSLSAAAYSGKSKYPIIYASSELGSANLKLLKEQGIKEVIIVGGESTVSPRVSEEIKGAGIKVARVSGKNRYETSKSIGQTYYRNVNVIGLADGDNFPDALSGAVLAGKMQFPILLTNKNNLDPTVTSFVKDNGVSRAYIFGGEKSVSSGVYGQLANSLVLPKAPVTSTPSVGQSEINLSTPSQAPVLPKVDNTKNVIHNFPIRKASKEYPIRILLDQGHGYGWNVSGPYSEGTEMYKFGHMLKEELQAYGFSVDTIRNSINQEKQHCIDTGVTMTNWLPVKTRGEMAEGYDLLLSLHSNASGPANRGARGTEVYDSTTTPLPDLARTLSASIANYFGHENRGLKYRYNDWDPKANKTNWYGVLRNSRATHSMMLEMGFHDHPDDRAKLLDDNFKRGMARVIARDVATYYGMPLQ